MKKIILKAAIAFLFTILLTFSSCKKEPVQTFPSDPQQIDLTPNQVSLISSENSFALDIFKNVIANSDESDNIIISPLSISEALSMTR